MRAHSYSASDAGTIRTARPPCGCQSDRPRALPPPQALILRPLRGNLPALHRYRARCPRQWGRRGHIAPSRTFPSPRPGARTHRGMIPHIEVGGQSRTPTDRSTDGNQPSIIQSNDPRHRRVEEGPAPGPAPRPPAGCIIAGDLGIGPSSRREWCRPRGPCAPRWTPYLKIASRHCDGH